MMYCVSGCINTLYAASACKSRAVCIVLPIPLLPLAVYICLFVAHQHQHPSCSPLFDCLCLSKESGDLQKKPAGDESVYKDSVLGAKSLSQGTCQSLCCRVQLLQFRLLPATDFSQRSNAKNRE